MMEASTVLHLGMGRTVAFGGGGGGKIPLSSSPKVLSRLQVGGAPSS